MKRCLLIFALFTAGCAFAADDAAALKQRVDALEKDTDAASA